MRAPSPAHSPLSSTELKALLLRGFRPFGLMLLQLWECFSLPEKGEETKVEAPVEYGEDRADVSEINASPKKLEGEMTF